MGRPTPPKDRQRRFWLLIRSGLSIEAAASATGVSYQTGKRWFVHGGGMPSVSLKAPSGRYLLFEERELIALLRAAGHGVREIARQLGRAPSTISRELRRNTQRQWPGRYLASAAQAWTDRRARRPKLSKLAQCAALQQYVQANLTSRERFSPEQISHRLRMDFPDDERMRISPEAIYQALYVQGRGELRRELARCLRTGRTLRKPRRRPQERRGRIRDMVMISERPPEVEDRAVPGHWEGDRATRGRTSGVNAPRGGSMRTV
jgi:IS30 family transposase